jgi:hypothetical protein
MAFVASVEIHSIDDNEAGWQIDEQTNNCTFAFCVVFDRPIVVFFAVHRADSKTSNDFRFRFNIDVNRENDFRKYLI